MKVFLVLSFLLPIAYTSGKRNLPEHEFHAEGPACPIDDPLEREVPLPFNVTLHDILNIELGSEMNSLLADGLSTLHYKFDVDARLLTFTFNITLEKVSGVASYSAIGYVDAHPFSQGTIPSGNFTGSGVGSLNATNVKLEGSGSFWSSLGIPNPPLSRLSLNTVSFDAFSIDLGTEFIIAGRSVDWASLSAEFKTNFDQEFCENKQQVAQRLRTALYLQDFIDFAQDIGEGSEVEC